MSISDPNALVNNVHASDSAVMESISDFLDFPDPDLDLDFPDPNDPGWVSAPDNSGIEQDLVETLQGLVDGIAAKKMTAATWVVPDHALLLAKLQLINSAKALEIEALARLQLKKAHMPLKTFREALKVASLEASGALYGGTPIRRATPEDSPVPHQMIPPPYYVTMDGINGPETGIVANLANSNDPSQPPVAKCFAPAAILLAERLRDLDSGAIALTMTWRYRDGQWAQHTVDKAIIMNPKLLLAAATYDVPVHGGNAALMSNYLYALESANRGTEGLPEHLTVAHLGWIGRTGEHGFLAGPDGMHVLSTGDRATDKTQVMFRGGDDGNHQLVAGYRAHGSYEGWLQAVRLIADKPVPQIILYSAFVPALLDILGAKNFILDLSGRTSLGKTTAARVAASVWGDPDESSPSAALATWDSTRVNAERMSTTLQSLPIILDDTKRVKNPKMVADMLYLVASGRGRGRGSTKGLAKVGTWRTVLISTGEQPATSFTTDGGTRARTLTMTGNPFGGEDDKTRRLVEKLNHALMMHYGHAGFRWASWILKHRSEWGKWQKNYVSTTNHYAAQAGNGAQARLAAHWAAIMVAGELVHRAFQLPWEFKAGNYGPLWGAAVQMAEDPAGELTALELVVSWAHSHQESFVGQAPDGRIPPQGWAGKWVAGVTEDGHGNSSYLAFYPTVLRSLLAGWEYQPDAILSGWKSRGWLDINGTGFTHPVRTTGKDAPRMIKLNAEALQAAEDERADLPF